MSMLVARPPPLMLPLGIVTFRVVVERVLAARWMRIPVMTRSQLAGAVKVTPVIEPVAPTYAAVMPIV